MNLALAKAIAKGDDDYERELLEEMLDLERDMEAAEEEEE